MGLLLLFVLDLFTPFVSPRYLDREATKEIQLLEVLVSNYEIEEDIQLEDGADLTQVLERFHLEGIKWTREPGVDPWGVPYVFVKNVDGRPFGIFTVGADGVANTEDDIANWKDGGRTTYYSKIRNRRALIKFLAVWLSVSTISFFWLRSIALKAARESADGV